MIVTIADVTPLKESERRRDEVLRFLSHDMRSPQASIITLLEMVRDDPDRIPQATLLDRIGKYSRRTLTLADDFLRMAKAERAKSSDFVPIELTGILQDVADEAEDAARGKSIRVVLKAPQDEAWVRGDRDLLTRAVINLLSNAIKYSLDFTNVTIALSHMDAPDRWRIDVSDEGFGVAPENMPRLFRRFQRIEQAGQPASDGIGLGLVFVKTVVERMSGEVQVSSQVMVNDGDPHGTTFSLLLPAIDLEPDEA
jgi:signal transduction histidine kinase